MPSPCCLLATVCIDQAFACLISDSIRFYRELFPDRSPWFVLALCLHCPACRFWRRKVRESVQAERGGDCAKARGAGQGFGQHAQIARIQPCQVCRHSLNGVVLQIDVSWFPAGIHQCLSDRRDFSDCLAPALTRFIRPLEMPRNAPIDAIAWATERALLLKVWTSEAALFAIGAERGV